MAEPFSAEPLAPSTPDEAGPSHSSQSSTVGLTDAEDLVVLESSPNRPGSSRTARLKDLARPDNGSSALPSRLSSFYFRGKQAQLLATPASTDAPQLISSSPPPEAKIGTPVAAAAMDFKRMDISAGKLAPADFGKVISQFKWTEGDSEDEMASSRASSRKRLASELDSPESAVACKRSTPVSVLSSDDDDDAVEIVSRGQPQRKGRLLRGSRPAVAEHPPSSPLLSTVTQPPATGPRRTLSRRPAPIDVESDDDEGDDDGDATGGFKRSFESIEPHVMKLFNEGTDEELMEKTGATPDEVAIVRGLRPFGDMDSVEYLLRKTRGVRLAIFNQYRDAVLGHAEVEAVISQCSGIFNQLKSAMKKAGVETNEATGVVSIAKEITLTQPKMISGDYELKHYQLEGVQWLDCLRNASASGILADEMGLGKTFQVIAFLCKGIEEAQVRGPSMVVCPSSTLDNWLNECAKFAPSLRVVAYYGSQAERMALQGRFEDESSYDVLVTTYNVATGNKMDRIFLKKRRFHSLILDEGHMVKNCMSSRYKWLMQIRTPFRLLLTGTPLQNNLQELVSLLTFILPQVFSESQPMLSHAFKTKPAAKRSAGGTESDDTGASSVVPSGAQSPAPQVVGAVETQHIGQAKTLLRPFVLRRRKCDVLSDLPSKTEIIVRLDLTESQRNLYDSIVPDDSEDAAAEAIRQNLMRLEPASLDVPEAVAPSRALKTPGASWISTFMDMRKVADHPLLLRNRYDLPQLQKMAKALLREPDYAEAGYQYVLEDMEVCSDFELHQLCEKYPRSMRQFRLPDEALLDSAKVQKLRAIVDECVARGEKLLLFSQFTSLLNILEVVFRMWDIEYCRLDGSTKVDERQAMIDEFNRDGNRLPVFLLSTKAGGFGINLTSANVVVIYDSGNNPSEERQAEDRAHRVGQVKDVRVYKFIGNDTIDVNIWESSKSKLMVEQMFWH
ncbi:DNA-dependent ATPase fun30 [Coemansia sp. IMI 209128]|nr:DNA-dependent ATPase fun30 [Coemansia sp. IMI 209128]